MAGPLLRSVSHLIRSPGRNPVHYIHLLPSALSINLNLMPVYHALNNASVSVWRRNHETQEQMWGEAGTGAEVCVQIRVSG